MNFKDSDIVVWLGDTICLYSTIKLVFDFGDEIRLANEDEIKEYRKKEKKYKEINPTVIFKWNYN